MKEMKSRHPDKPFDDEQLEKDAFEVIAKFLQGQFKTTTTTLPDPKDCQECQDLPVYGQAHHMFSRFLILGIYNFFHEIFFVLFFLQGISFLLRSKMLICITLYHNKKSHFEAL
jgi:hypothetical protein